ncbi:MAG: ATP-binding protein [Planctomycetota bacterium]
MSNAEVSPEVIAASAAEYDVLPLGVCIVDAKLTVCAWNRTLEGWTGINRGDIIGRPLSEQYPDVARRGIASRLAAVFRDGAPIVFSAALHRHFLPILQPTGVLMPQRTHVTPCGDGSGRAAIVIEDLTHPMSQLEQLRRDRNRLEQSQTSLRRQQEELEATNTKLTEASRKAEEANRSKSEFLANMSHEIRTPLTAILGFADILVDGADPEAGVAAAETIRRNGEHLLAIVNDILDLSKIEAGRVEADLTCCSPLDIAEEVTSLMRVRAEARGIGLHLRIGDGVPGAFHSDPIRLRQVLLNLLGNAVKFTDEGRVELVVEAAETKPPVDGSGQIVFSVSDTGIGIPADKLRSIFEPFNQADTSAQRRFGGTGLGLAICGRLATTLGGTIGVTSEPGAGSTFRLAIPMCKASCEAPKLGFDCESLEAAQREKPLPAPSPPKPAPPQAIANDARPLAGRRVLIAEDGPDNQRLIAYHLKKAGAEVTVVENGQQAVEALTAEPSREPAHELVLMDMQMPVLDGYQATTELRKRGHAGPIIALTAHAMEGDRKKALAAGCDDYATKPINAPQLIEMIRGWLGKSATTAAE